MPELTPLCGMPVALYAMIFARDHRSGNRFRSPRLALCRR